MYIYSKNCHWFCNGIEVICLDRSCLIRNGYLIKEFRNMVQLKFIIYNVELASKSILAMKHK